MTLKQRIMTGLFAGAGFIGVVYLGGYWFTALLIVMSIIGMFEFIKINQFSLWNTAAWISYASMLYFTLPLQRITYIQMPSIETLLWFLLFIFLSITVITKNRVTFDHAALYVIGIMYIGFGFHYMMQTIWLEDAFFWSILIFTCIWATDSGAYFSGRSFGKHKLWPSISPKKTIEGAIGGIVLAIVAAMIFAWVRPELLSFADAVGIGFVIAVTGQFGDLIESAFKRFRNVKDSGTILPGHGGILDRTDSWLIVFPIVHILFF
jgi:phosphatidate cytidylyltransferase